MNHFGNETHPFGTNPPAKQDQDQETKTGDAEGGEQEKTEQRPESGNVITDPDATVQLTDGRTVKVSEYIEEQVATERQTLEDEKTRVSDYERQLQQQQPPQQNQQPPQQQQGDDPPPAEEERPEWAFKQLEVSEEDLMSDHEGQMINNQNAIGGAVKQLLDDNAALRKDLAETKELLGESTQISRRVVIDRELSRVQREYGVDPKDVEELLVETGNTNFDHLAEVLAARKLRAEVAGKQTEEAQTKRTEEVAKIGAPTGAAGGGETTTQTEPGRGVKDYNNPEEVAGKYKAWM